MKRIFLVCILLQSISLTPAVAQAVDQCARWEQARERIYQQLRKGYSVSRGNQLRARMRELDSLIAHNCR